MPSNYNAFAYVLDGEGLFGADEESAGDGQMVLFTQDGEDLTITEKRRSSHSFQGWEERR